MSYVVLTNLEVITHDLQACTGMLRDIELGYTKPTCLPYVRKIFEKYCEEYLTYRQIHEKAEREEENRPAKEATSTGSIQQITLDQIIEMNLKEGILTVKQATSE